MGILEQLKEPNFKVTKSDKTLIKYIETNLESVIYKSISEIARESNIGEATITRFTKKAGFSGFQDFKVTLAKDLSIQNKTSVISSHVHKDEGVMETANKLLQATINVLDGTVCKIDKNIINQCRELILTAKKIYFIGIGYSGVVAIDSNYKFMRIGLNTVPITDSHTMVIMSAIMNRGDVIVAISHSGTTKEILKTVELAKENKVKIISLTEDTDNPLRNLSDAELTYVSSETILETGSFSSKIQQIFLMDLVYTEVIKDMFNEAVDRKLRTTNAIEYYNEGI
ncbi:DNA-binding MurR/RpiR family transcriptional regulator [Clostridium moniliforme]|uniref:DNA-binding MurR/RpiR family transcriptional regulator n=1 Tax=Clostridium moniliforme TaxID=39489 RepID=A0ABS4F343_9CLOT|nr:MurR/RpiR family transcriptional regulator [Clostridium moniliforme]MBP1890689.1 DNA-binding MurR/RpiR family transcriptional regulator [Clostridium moniliforme]